jgi:hypothetical protein
MARKPRDAESGGLRERLYFARLLLDEMDQGLARQEPRARLLALRGAVLSHLYAVPVALLRRSAARYQVYEAGDLISLSALARAFDDAGMDVPEARLVEQARQSPQDPLAWLDEQMLAGFDSPGMALRPDPPSENNDLLMRAEDEDEVLGAQDLARMRDCLERLERLRYDCEPHGEEW